MAKLTRHRVFEIKRELDLDNPQVVELVDGVREIMSELDKEKESKYIQYIISFILGIFITLICSNILYISNDHLDLEYNRGRIEGYGRGFLDAIKIYESPLKKPTFPPNIKTPKDNTT